MARPANREPALAWCLRRSAVDCDRTDIPGLGVLTDEGRFVPSLLYRARDLAISASLSDIFDHFHGDIRFLAVKCVGRKRSG